MGENAPEQAKINLIAWEVDETERYKRGRAWYIGMTLLGLGLLIYAVISANFLFALLILMFALVIYLTSLRAQDKIRVELNEDGIKIGENFYPYRELRRYWFIYQPPEVKVIYLDFKNVMRSRLSLPLANQNPNEVRAVIGRYVYEDLAEEDEPFVDILARLLKL